MKKLKLFTMLSYIVNCWAMDMHPDLMTPLAIVNQAQQDADFAEWLRRNAGQYKQTNHKNQNSCKRARDHHGQSINIHHDEDTLQETTEISDEDELYLTNTPCTGHAPSEDEDSKDEQIIHSYCEEVDFNGRFPSECNAVTGLFSRNNSMEDLGDSSLSASLAELATCMTLLHVFQPGHRPSTDINKMMNAFPFVSDGIPTTSQSLPVSPQRPKNKHNPHLPIDL